MIEYRGLSIETVDENQIEFVLASHNVMGLKIFFEAGTGYKDGDRIEINISNHGCTHWSGKAISDSYSELRNINILFDGNSESEMASTIFALVAKVISYRHDGIAMTQIAKIIQRRINACASVSHLPEKEVLVGDKQQPDTQSQKGLDDILLLMMASSG